MTKSGSTPHSTAWRRRNIAQNAWNVLTTRPRRPGTSGGSMDSTRFFISPAALLVKVSARICHAGMPSATRRATRRVMTRVLPEPGPAITRSGPSTCDTAARWSSVRPSRSSSGSRTGAAAGKSASCRGSGSGNSTLTGLHATQDGDSAAHAEGTSLEDSRRHAVHRPHSSNHHNSHDLTGRWKHTCAAGKVKSIKTNFNALQPQPVGVPCAPLPTVGGVRESESYRTIAERTA